MAGIPVIPDLTHIYINFEFGASETYRGRGGDMIGQRKGTSYKRGLIKEDNLFKAPK